MVDHDDEALSRLRASDPATGSHPDLHHLRTLIAQKAPASQGSDVATRVDDDLLRGPRLRAPWIAAAAVAALGLGVGGYALGLQQGDGAPAPVAGQTTEVLPASPGLQPGTDVKTEMGGDAAAGMASSADMASEASGDPMAYDPGPVRLVAGEGLPSGPATGEVRALVSTQGAQEFLDAWAERTGFEGEPIPSGADSMFGMEGVGLVDGPNGRVMHASESEGALSFGYEDIFGGEYCTDMWTGMPEADLAMAKEEWSKAYGGAVPFPDASNCREATGPAPTEEQAKATVKDFFADAGIDVEDYTFETYDNGGESSYVMVDAWPAGMEYGQINVSATVGPEGVVSAYGMQGEFASLGEYPIITASEAVDRYRTREWSMDYGVSIAEDHVAPAPMDEASMTWAEPDYTMPENGPLQPGQKIPVLLKDKTVTDAELVRGTMWVQGAGSIEVPVWKLMTGDGMHYSVLALAEEALDFQSWE